MKIYTDRHILVSLTNFPFSGKTFDLLLQLSVIAPNLRLEAVEVHTGKSYPVRLCMLDFSWHDANLVNLPAH